MTDRITTNLMSRGHYRIVIEVEKSRASMTTWQARDWEDELGAGHYSVHVQSFEYVPPKTVEECPDCDQGILRNGNYCERCDATGLVRP